MNLFFGYGNYSCKFYLKIGLQFMKIMVWMNCAVLLWISPDKILHAIKQLTEKHILTVYNNYSRMVINHLCFNSHSRTLIFYKRQFSVSNYILSNSHKTQNVIIHRIKTHRGWTLSLNPKGCTLLFYSNPLYTFSLLKRILHAFVPPSTCPQFTVLSLSI